jgi:hypothetical protein
MPRDGHVDTATSLDPMLGGCLVTIPAGSPLATAGVGGGPIGARVLYRLENGQATAAPLWDPTTGAFPCGATVTGLNDAARADVSCLGFHARLGVGANGCGTP